MHGIKRVLVFCTLTTVLPTVLFIIPLYLRHSFYADVAYAVTESDILEINDGISTLFCSEHTLQMNGSFNAFQMSHRPEIASSRKHLQLKKSMNLPDDTLEYWGFYLLRGATVALSVCSRFQGASILVVKGERNLRTCGMLEHSNNKNRVSDMYLPDRQVKITFESTAQEINSKESVNTYDHHKLSKVKMPKVTTASVAAVTMKLVTETKSSTESYNNHLNTYTPNDTDELYREAEMYALKHLKDDRSRNHISTRKLRHAKRRLHKVEVEKDRKEQEKEKYIKKLKEMLQHERDTDNESEEVNGSEERKRRQKRNQDLFSPPSLLDQGIRHGGNAGRNLSDTSDASSVSSFENGLLSCYEGSILLAQEFDPSDQCIDVNYLLSGKHMQTKHNVTEDGYYYYIFYSDNDFVSNDIHALFDIYKPTFQYENVTKSCINQTECTFALTPMSLDKVIVEVPTKDGIEHELDEIHLLISVCHPRMGIYVIFPIAVLFFVLGCAFM
ncbi:uncharacterized protein [Prorops nasuta]|uniref:uncharacterized protein n=1 Tax=Prorops nasuta TaxID=863751 RepID=UPI0034CE4B97